MAGQRGAGANAGLLARQAAQQGAATQQQAAGQGATMQAQQSLNAIQAAGQLANQQAQQQAAATGAVTQAQMGEQNQLLGALQGYNQAQAGLAQTQMQGQQGLLGGVLQAAGPALGMAGSALGKLFADGGGVYGDTSQDNFDTASAQAQTPASTTSAPAAPSIQTPAAASVIGQVLNAKKSQGQPSTQGQAMQRDYGNRGANALYQGAASLGNLFKPQAPAQPTPQAVSGGAADTTAGGGQNLAPNTGNIDMNQDQTAVAARGGKVKKVPAMVSPGEIYLTPRDVEKVKKGKKSPLEGEKIPGKPKVKGAKNSYANDTVPKTLEEGGIVLPRSVTQAKHPHWAAHKFVQDIMMKKHRKK
jgi:hypothetical protein